jgi:ABC-type dipeptide/oligopeptide/nickel transport system permease component
MLAIFGRETARFGAGLAGAVMFAAALAALAGSTSFGTHVWDALSLEFGRSTLTGRDALAEILPALASSLVLLAPGLMLAFVIGVPLGLLLANRNTQSIFGPLMQLGRAVPVFCGALLIAVLVAAIIPSVETGRGVALRTALATNDAVVILGALAALAPLVIPIALAGAGAVASVVCGAMDEALGEPYRESLMRLGMSPTEILRVYVARRALAQSLTGLGDVFLAGVAATAVVERLFEWPGAGALFMHAAALHDWAVVAALVFMIAAARIVTDFVGAMTALILTGRSR